MVVYGFLLLNASLSSSSSSSSTRRSSNEAPSSSSSPPKETKASKNEAVIWACRFYDKEGNDKFSCIRAKAVAARVKQEFLVSCDEDDFSSRQELESQNREARGVFRLPSNKLFSSPKTVHWLARGGALCTLICEEHTNVILAANQLGLLVEGVSKHFGPEALISPTIVNENPEELYMLLDRFMPCGLLQFLSENDVKREVAELASLTPKHEI